MSRKGSPLKTVIMAPPGGLSGLQQCGDDNSESPDSSSPHATRNDSQFGKHTIQYHPPQGYGYPSSQQPFPGAPQFHHRSPFYMTHSSQPTISASQGFPSYGPPWQRYDLHQGGDGRSQMFPPLQLPGQGPWTPGAPRVPPEPPGYHPVNQLTSSSSTPPPQPLPDAPGRHPIRLPTRRFQPWAKPRKQDVARIADLPPFAERSYDEYDAAVETDDLSDLDGAVRGSPLTVIMALVIGPGKHIPCLCPPSLGQD